MNNKDLYYNSYGYIPTFNNPQSPFPQQNQLPYNPYQTNQFNDVIERINRIERQIKRLDQRLSKLETQYNNKNNEPDNNMYMM